MRAHPRSDLVGGSLVWLLEVVYAGQVYRWSSYPIELSSDAGPLSFAGGLAPVAYEETVDRLEASIATADASLEVVFPVDVALQHRRGHHLQGSAATLSTVAVRDGSPVSGYEGRVVQLAGEISLPQYGDPERAAGWAAFTISGSVSDDVARFHAPSMRISPETWSGTHEVVVKNHGRPYPIIVGLPGRVRESGVVFQRGSPAYAVVYDVVGIPNGIDTLLVAGHHVGGTNVVAFVDSTTPALFALLVVANGYDNLGQPVATVDISAESDEFRSASEYWVSWWDPSFQPITQRNPYRVGGVLRGAGDVLRWALSRSSLPVDHAAFGALAPALNALKIDTYINDPDTSPWEWLLQILAYLPVTLRRGSRGIYPILHDTGGGSPLGAVAVTEGPDFRQIGPVQVERDNADITAELSVEYALWANTSAYSRLRYTAGTVKTSDRERTSTTAGRVAHTRHGAQRREVISLPWVYDPATASAILRQQLRERTGQITSTSYDAASSWGWLTVGQQLSLTSARLHLSAQLVEVVAKSWDGQRWRFGVLQLSDPVRDRRP